MARGPQVRPIEFKPVTVGERLLFLLRGEDTGVDGFALNAANARLKRGIVLDAAVEGQRVPIVGIGPRALKAIEGDKAFVQDMTEGGRKAATMWTGRIRLSDHGVRAPGFHTLNLGDSVDSIGPSFAQGKGETVEQTWYIYGDKVKSEKSLWFVAESGNVVRDFGTQFVLVTVRGANSPAQVVIGEMAQSQAVILV